MKKAIAATTAAAVAALVGSVVLFASAQANANSIASPQDAVNQGASNAAGQGYNQRVSVRDKNTGQLLAQTPNANEPVASESLVKLFTAVHEIVTNYGTYQNVPQSELDALAYMIEYSDDASESARFTYQDVPWTAARYGLSGNTNNGPTQWGGVSITANDETLFLYEMLKDPAVGPFIGSVMSQVKQNGSDGFDQYFGFNALSGVHGSKQGWGSDNWTSQANTISSIGFTDKYVSAVLSTGADNGSYNGMGAYDTVTAQLIQASGFAPVQGPVPVNQRLDTVAIDRFGNMVIHGYAADPSSNAPTTVTVYLDNQLLTNLTANLTYGALGYHGFTTGTQVRAGYHTVTFQAHALAGSINTPEFSITLAATYSPVIQQSLDSVTSADGTITVTGFAFDPTRTSQSSAVNIAVDGRVVATSTTNVPRGDVNYVFGISGNHGYCVTIKVKPGAHTVRVANYAVVGSQAGALWSRSLTVNAYRDVQQVLNYVTQGKGYVLNVIGWAYDVTNTSAGSRVYVFADGRQVAANILTNSVRGDVNNAFGIRGTHGYNIALTFSGPGRHTVQVTVLPAPGSSSHQVQSRSLIGTLTTVSR